MKSLLLIVLSLAFSVIINAQTYSFWIEFTDKSNTPYSISNPEEFLSQRAIDRRTRQSIDITEQDLPVDPAYVQYVLNNYSVNYRHVSKWFNSLSISTSDSSLIDSIRLLNFVVDVEPVTKMYMKKVVEDPKNFTSPNQNRLSLSSERSLDYGQGFDQINIMGGIEIHDAGFKGEGMQIAILDAGFPNVDVLPIFDSLRVNGQILDVWDFVNSDGSVYEQNSHGTMVLSTMGGNLPGQLVGTAPKASYHLYITEDISQEAPIEEDNWIAGAERADSVGADVCNTSLGYTELDNPNMSHTYSDLDGNTLRISIGADIAASKGMFMVNSAGNSGNSSWYYIGAPADADSVLTVGAVNAAGELAGFSSRGPSADGDIKPNVVGVGWDAAIANTSGDVILGNGTSFSGPIIAGMSACLWQCMPNATNMELKLAIEQSAHLANNPDNEMGYGIPNYTQAHSLLTGIQIPSKESGLKFEGPNPFLDKIEFSYLNESFSGLMLIELFDQRGRLMFSKSEEINKGISHSFSLNVNSKLSSGIYFMKISGESLLETYKVMKW